MNSASRLRKIWYGMRERCNNPNAYNYHRYGGKGIKICDEWNIAENFEMWSYANGYNDTLTIDRIDSNGNYSPENCRWVDSHIQQSNRSTPKNNTSGYKGVRCDKAKRVNQWIATLSIAKNKRLRLGCYSTKEEAYQARKKYILDNKLTEYYSDIID